MIVNKALTFTAGIFLLSPMVLSDYDPASIEHFIKKEQPEPSLYRGLTAMFLYQNTRASVQHQESSPDAGFTSLNQTSDIQLNTAGVQIEREFNRGGTLSLNLQVRASVVLGIDEQVNPTNNLTYKDKAGGLIYGAGVSLNMNTSAFGLRVQPFVATCYTQGRQDFTLSYADVDNGDQTTTITYDVSRQYLDHAVGIRFFNERQFMTYLAANFIQELNQEVSVSGVIGQSTITLTNPGTVEHESFAFTIGGGYQF